jgi:BMFP domain-containing protein YqiC
MSYEQNLASSLLKQCYPFAHALIPEELQCQQVLIDALGAALLEDPDSVKEVMSSVSREKDNRPMQGLVRDIYSRIYKLAQKRVPHLDLVTGESFYRLPLNVRAVVFLKNKNHMDYRLIGLTLGMEYSQVVSFYHIGREQLLSQSDSIKPEVSHRP